MGAGSSKQKGQGFDLTPGEFQDLRGPLRDFFLGQLPGLADAFSFTDVRDQEGGLDRLRTPLSGEEFLNIDRLQQQAEGLSPNEQAAEDLLGRRLRGEFFDPAENDALRDVIRFTTANINDTFNAQDLQQRSLFARAGHRLDASSPFATAQAISNVGRVDAIGENTANLLFGNLQSERQRQTEAIEQQRANSLGIFQRSQAALEASALPRLIDDEGIDRGLAEFQSRLAAISNVLNTASGLAAPTSSQSSSGSSKNAGVLSGSSLRFKHDVVDLGDPTTQFMKLAPVTFEYNGDAPMSGVGVFGDAHRDRKRIGLIAEHVEKLFPDVIGYSPLGDRVDGIYYNELVPVLIAVVQSLVQRVEELEGA